MRFDLSSKTRTDFRKSETKRLRRESEIPATVYGKGDKSKSIAVPSEDFTQILKTPGGRLSLIDLEVDGKSSKAHPVMVQKIQRDPISNRVLHVDFHRVSMNEPVHAPVPVILVGDPPGIKQGGILEQFTREIEIKALPDRIPTQINVDVSQLDLGNVIHVSDVALPEDVEVLGPAADSVVATVRLPIIHAEAEPAATEEEAAEAAAPAAEAAAAAEEAAEES